MIEGQKPEKETDMEKILRWMDKIEHQLVELQAQMTRLEERSQMPYQRTDYAMGGCSICGAKTGDMCCLGIHASVEDKARGGSGIVYISCPCPRCSPSVMMK